MTAVNCLMTAGIQPGFHASHPVQLWKPTVLQITYACRVPKLLYWLKIIQIWLYSLQTMPALDFQMKPEKLGIHEKSMFDKSDDDKKWVSMIGDWPPATEYMPVLNRRWISRRRGRLRSCAGRWHSVTLIRHGCRRLRFGLCPSRWYGLPNQVSTSGA